MITKLLVIFLLIHCRLSRLTNCGDMRCNTYIQKLSELYFMTGNIVVVLDQLPNVQMNIGYSDIQFFDDPEYLGAYSISLSLKLLEFTSNTYSDYIQVTDLPISVSSDVKRKQRYYSFTIQGEKLQQYFVQTSNTNQYIFKGYYAIAYYSKDYDVLQEIFYLEFFLTVNKQFTQLINQGFRSFNIKDTLNCNLESNCSFTEHTNLKFCSSINCTNTTHPDLHFNDEIILQQILISQSSKQFYLTHPEVWYIGEGLQKQAKLISIDNKQPGEIKIELQVEIVWSGILTIQVISQLENVITNGEISTLGSVFGETDKISFIKAEGSESSPTCDDQYQAQGYAISNCPESGSQISVILTKLSIILLISF